MHVRDDHGRATRSLAGALVIGAFVASCGSGAHESAGANASPSASATPPVDDAGPEAMPFVALAADFAGYRAWTAFVPEGGAPGNDHVSGPRTVYVNRLPATSAHAFPIGTIFVKESGDGDVSTHHVFASVKRGGGFNEQGAVGWELFELTATAGGSPSIVWRGVGPATGDAYGGPTGGCNACHSLKQMDYSWTAEEFGLLTPLP
jgi:hypothetical protein